MVIKFIYSIISLVLIVLCPIAFYLFGKHKNAHIFAWDIVVGIVIDFLCKHVIVNNLIGLMSKNDTMLSFLSSTYCYLIVYVALTSIILFLGLTIINKYYYHNNYSYDNVFGLTIGMSIADILNTTLMASISNLLFIRQIQNGTLYSNLINSVSSQEAAKIVDMYSNFPSSYFLYIGIITLALLASNYLISVLMLNIKKEKIQSSLMIIFTISLFTIVYYFTDPIKFVYANPVLLLFMGIQFIFAELYIRIMKIEDKNRAK